MEQENNKKEDSPKSKFALGITNNGRPPAFKNPEDLESKCLDYFIHCVDEGEKVTITGLTLHVGFCSRASWDDYKKRDGFSYIVKRAKLTVENSYESNGSAFDIFALKNMGWIDKQNIDHTTKDKEIKTDIAPQINVYQGNAPSFSSSETEVD